MDTLRLSVDGPLARVTLDRPQVLNAGDAAWVRDLNAVVAHRATEIEFEHCLASDDHRRAMEAIRRKGRSC